MLAETWAGLILGLIGHAATNVDNSVVLISIFGAKRESTTAVSLGFATGSMVMLAIALVLSFIGEMIPVRYLGYLGVIPIFLGILELTRSASPARRASTASDPALRRYLGTLCGSLHDIDPQTSAILPETPRRQMPRSRRQILETWRRAPVDRSGASMGGELTWLSMGSPPYGNPAGHWL